jgi:hypothetical protein
VNYTDLINTSVKTAMYNVNQLLYPDSVHGEHDFSSLARGRSGTTTIIALI